MLPCMLKNNNKKTDIQEDIENKGFKGDRYE